MRSSAPFATSHPHPTVDHSGASAATTSAMSSIVAEMSRPCDARTSPSIECAGAGNGNSSVGTTPANASHCARA